MIGTVAQMMLPSEDDRVSSPRLKNMKYTENPVAPETREPAAVFEVKRFAHAGEGSDYEQYYSSKHAADKPQIK